ncbi:MAG: CTP synthetase [Maritimibacter sp.]|nr:CTP synthetase [Maritimibacter sp.]
MALFLLVYIFMSATLAGSALIAALSLNLDTMQPVLYAAIAGFVVAVPVAWVIAKKIRENV